MEEDIKKLNQMDRIEYRIRKLDNSVDFSHLAIQYQIIISLCFMFAGIVVIVGVLQDTLRQDKPFILSLIILGSIFLILQFVVFAYYFYKESKLKKEYFDTVVKKK